MLTRIKCAGIALVVLAAMAFVGTARAQTIYFGGEAGWSNLENETDRIGGTKLHAKFNSGFAAGARAGYEWGPWRFEEEYVYRSNDLSSLRLGSTKLPGVSGGRDPSPERRTGS